MYRRMYYPKGYTEGDPNCFKTPKGMLIGKGAPPKGAPLKRFIAKGIGKQNKQKQKKKQPKSPNKNKRYVKKIFEKIIKKYGERRKTLRTWEKDMALLWLDKAREKLAERTKKEREEKEKEEAEAAEEEIIEDINVKSVDLHVEKNAIAHHTDDFFATKDKDNKDNPKLQELVVRRGQPFTMTVVCDRPYEKEKYDMQLVFETGPSPSMKNETLARIEIDESGAEPEDTENWHARLVKLNGNEMEIEVLSPNDCLITEWTLKILTIFVSKDDKVKQLSYEYPNDITILLNPWCKDDTCYYNGDPKDLEEYVLNDYGCVYVGSVRFQSPREWFFGQFEEDILDVALHLIRRANKFCYDQNLGDATFIAREISNVVNNNVLVGNWSGKYDGGESPTHWSGSVKILRKFKKNKEPVKFGQCWVFSAVSTAVCRALGLPCRSVTCFASAHDTDSSTAIDRIYKKNEQGKREKVQADDSIWNFHVWNEVWMARPDLPDGYGGWQIIDATPQELSDGEYKCGPAPQVAVKNGECELPYDTAFVFAEVNSDICEWDLVGPFMYDMSRVLTDRTGKFISTKVCNGEKMIKPSWRDENQDIITDAYKFKEGSEEERAAVENAKSGAKFSYGDYKAKPKEIEIAVKDVQKAMVGENVEVEFTIKNVSEDKGKRTVLGVEMIVWSCSFMDKDAIEVQREDLGNFEINYGEEETIKTKVFFDNYWKHLREFGSMKVVISCSCAETQRDHVEDDEFRITRPDLTVTGPEECFVGDTVEVEVSFKNPVPVPLTDCKLSVDTGNFEIEGFPDDDSKMKLGDIAPNAELKQVLKFKAVKKSKRKVAVLLKLESEDLRDIYGDLSISVKARTT